jgi:hypothetical protein
MGERFAQRGVKTVGGFPKQFTVAIREVIGRWGKVTRDTNMRSE